MVVHFSYQMERIEAVYYLRCTVPNKPFVRTGSPAHNPALGDTMAPLVTQRSLGARAIMGCNGPDPDFPTPAVATCESIRSSEPWDYETAKAAHRLLWNKCF